MSTQLLRDIIQLFASNLKPGLRGKSVRSLDELELLASQAEPKLLTEFLRLHRGLMSFAPGVTAVGTGHKGLVLDYYPSRALARGTKFCALLAVPRRQQLHLYFHRLHDVPQIHGITVFRQPTGGTPHIWVNPDPNIAASLLRVLRDSYDASIIP